MELALLTILIVGITVIYAYFGVRIGRRLIKSRVREGHNDVLVPIFLTAGTLYAVLLAFIVIAVWETYTDAGHNAAEEASTLTTLYRQTNGMAPTEQHHIRDILRAYTEDVIRNEWPIQAKTGGASPGARKGIADLYRAYATMPAKTANLPINVEFLATLRTVAADRNKRTLQANEHLPSVIWFIMIFGATVVVGMSFILYMDEEVPHAFATAVMASLIGTMLLITFVLDKPFNGPLAISADSFEHSLGVYHSVDMGD